jgi:uracil-DNA glycosylase
MEVKIEESWKKYLEGAFSSDWFAQLASFLREEKQKGVTIYPPGSMIFRAFNTTPVDKVKVVIIGQDPYHQPGQANGLCFSVFPKVKIPPSLNNIYKEIERDLGITPPNHGSLESWAEQGVLLLNATLTVRHGEAGSHQKKGWETFTDYVIQQLNEKQENLVFMLWGKFAQEKGKWIDRKKHLVLEAGHPSPLSIGSSFHGCGHFSACNQYLSSHGLTPIDWQIQNLY